MWFIPYRSVLVFGVLTACAIPGVATAATPKLNDGAHLFQPESVLQAAPLLKEIKHDYDKDLVIETFQKIPWWRGSLQKVKNMDQAGQDQFFLSWAEKRVRLSPNCILVFIFHEQELFNVQVTLGREIKRQKSFSPEDVQDLRSLLLNDHRGHRDDAGLRDAITFVSGRLNYNLGGPRTSRDYDWMGIGIFILGILSIWVIVEIVQALTHGEIRAGYAGVSTVGLVGGGGLIACLAALAYARLKVAGPAHDPVEHASTLEFGKSAGGFANPSSQDHGAEDAALVSKDPAGGTDH